MSIWYSVNIILNVPFKECAIKKILANGTAVGCLYVKGSLQGLHNNMACFTENNVTQKILDTLKVQKEDINSYVVPSVEVNFLDTFFPLCFSEDSDYLRLWMSLQGGNWSKIKSFMDFERYIRLLINLYTDMPAIWLYTWDEGYDEDFYYHYKGSRCALREQADVAIAPDFKVDATILPDWTSDTFHNLLNHGTIAGWHYYMPLEATSNKTALSSEGAVSYILKESPAGKTEVSLNCIIDNTKHLLTFRLRFDTFFMFTLKPLSESVDLPRTVQHALDLCTDFCILELNTFDARYNYYKEPFDSEKS